MDQLFGFRLGAFGFYSTQVGSLGHYGLLSQTELLLNFQFSFCWL